MQDIAPTLSKKKKIIIFRNQLFKLSESFIFNQAEAMNNYDVIYVGRKNFSSDTSGVDFFSIDKESVFKNLSYILFRNAHLSNVELKKKKPKLIHAHFGVDSIYAMRLAKKLNIPLVTTFHGFDATTKKTSQLFSFKPAWINYFFHEKSLIKNGDLFICVSEFIKNKVIALGFPSEKVVTHHIGIKITPPPLNKKNYNSKTILHVARLTEKKGTKYLIEALPSIISIHPSAKLIIIGDGPLMNDLKKLSKDLNVSKNIEFMGSQPNSVVMNWMEKVDLFCLPSITAKSGDSEGLPIVLLEASLAMLPTVATLHSGIPECVDDGITGFLVKEKSSYLIAEKINLLMSDENLCKRMGAAGRLMVEEKFDIVKQSQKLEELYKRVLK